MCVNHINFARGQTDGQIDLAEPGISVWAANRPVVFCMIGRKAAYILSIVSAVLFTVRVSSLKRVVATH